MSQLPCLTIQGRRACVWPISAIWYVPATWDFMVRVWLCISQCARSTTPYGGRAVLRGLLQDGAVLAPVLDLFGQAGQGWLAIRPQGDLGRATTVDEARDELRGEGRSLHRWQIHRCGCSCVLFDDYERGGELLVREVTPALVLLKQQSARSKCWSSGATASARILRCGSSLPFLTVQWVRHGAE